MVGRGARAFAGAALVATAGATGVEAGTCALPAWAPGAPAFTFHAAGVASAGGFVYFAGGVRFPGPLVLSQIARYDVTANSWFAFPGPPVAVAGASLAYDAVGGRLFLFGGSDLSAVFNVIQVYTIATNAWSSGPPMPAARWFMGSGVIGGMSYLVGGYGSTVVGSPAETQNWRFNPVSGTFTPLASLPSGVGGPGSGVSGGRLYIMGGKAGTILNTNYEYDPIGNVWATRAPLPTAVYAPGSAALSGDPSCAGDIILAGGEVFGSPPQTGITQLYNVSSNSWSSGPTLAQARSFIGAAQAGNTLVAAGGLNGTSSGSLDRIQGPPLPVWCQDFRVEQD
jgi:Kelch motif protein